ncbi:unnamed protein product [Paramecium octaurelia]|uniref:Uncharacterized protein n=1 Tax=Paramecium octaurelia TaxID=43137 RepID=A0A8S1T9V2_PAROT|nr:unnamed protein product [Paramecium octaurelia]
MYFNQELFKKVENPLRDTQKHKKIVIMSQYMDTYNIVISFKFRYLTGIQLILQEFFKADQFIFSIKFIYARE